jgi:hypothetical protein
LKSIILTARYRHIKRVLGYARTSDYIAGGAAAVAGPGLMLLWEKVAPSYVGKGGFAPIMRLSGVIGAGAGFLLLYQRSISAYIPPLQILSGAKAITWLDSGIEKELHVLMIYSAILWLHGEQA